MVRWQRVFKEAFLLFIESRDFCSLLKPLSSAKICFWLLTNRTELWVFEEEEKNVEQFNRLRFY